MKESKDSFLDVWLLLAGLCVMAGVVLWACLVNRDRKSVV